MLLLSTVLVLLLEISGEQLLKYTDTTTFIRKLEETLKNQKVKISSKCTNHLLYYTEALNSGEQWALQMFDASTKGMPSGIMEGNLFDLGSFDECLNVVENKKRISGKYCISRSYIRIPENQKTPLLKQFESATSAGNVSIFLAKCFPDSCSIRDIEIMYDEAGDKINLSQELCQTKAMQEELDYGGFATILLFAVIFGIVICSTVYDIVGHYSKKKQNHSVLVTFSIFTNFKKLIEITNVPSEITCLHGIRVIALMWIVTAHRFTTSIYFPATNFESFSKMLLNEANMFICSTMFAVDTFFVLSGLLISYNYMIQMKRGSKFNIICYYVQRYLRLTPALAVLILFSITLMKHTGSGPFWKYYMETNMIPSCANNWWTTLLYIQNIYNTNHYLCIHPTWYLSADMQLFIISPLLLLPLKKWTKLTLSIIGLLLICSMSMCLFIIWYYELNSTSYGVFDYKTYDQYLWHYFYPFYGKPSSPWLIGLLTGYFVFKSKEKKLKFTNNKVVVFILWVISLTTMGACTFAGTDLLRVESNTKIAVLLHAAFAQFAWATAISWIILACVNECAGPVNWFLSLPVFQVLSRLTYTVFLNHAIIISILINSMKTIIPFTSFKMVYEVWGDFAYSLGVALLLSLTVEIPITNISKLLKQ